MGRALLRAWMVANGYWEFQSSPVLWDGRYNSITPHINPIKMFQSSPVLWDGRYHSWPHAVRHKMLFQSSPVLWDGRYTLDDSSYTPALIVSILARPVGRALRAERHISSPLATFQSSPVLWDGRYG